MRCAFPPEINATRTCAVTKRSSRACIPVASQSKRPSPLVNRDNVKQVVQIAGFRKSIVIEQTTKAKPGASCRASFSSSR